MVCDPKEGTLDLSNPWTEESVAKVLNQDLGQINVQKKALVSNPKQKWL